MDPPEVRRSGDDVIIRSDLNPALRHFHEKILKRTKTETIAAVAGQADYAVPAAAPLFAVENVSFGTPRAVLMKTTRAEAVERDEAPSTPRFWYDWEGKIWLDPAPAAGAPLAIQLDLYGGPAPYTAAEPAPAVVEVVQPTNWEDAVIEYAVFRSARRHDERGVAADALAEFERLCIPILRERELDTRPPQRRDAFPDRRFFI